MEQIILIVCSFTLLSYHVNTKYRRVEDIKWSNLKCCALSAPTNCNYMEHYLQHKNLLKSSRILMATQILQFQGIGVVVSCSIICYVCEMSQSISFWSTHQYLYGLCDHPLLWVTAYRHLQMLSSKTLNDLEISGQGVQCIAKWQHDNQCTPVLESKSTVLKAFCNRLYEAAIRALYAASVQL